MLHFQRHNLLQLVGKSIARNSTEMNIVSNSKSIRGATVIGSTYDPFQKKKIYCPFPTAGPGASGPFVENDRSFPFLFFRDDFENQVEF